MLKHIPNALTCCNLLCGCLGLVEAFQGSLVNASYLIGFAAIFDFLDGFAARLLKASSPIGKDLDSLADIVTFGVLPGVIVFMLLKSTVYNFQFGQLVPFLAFLIPVFSALRLAKFNNDPRQSDIFFGLPTPANAIFFASFPLILKFDTSISSMILIEPILLVVLTLLSCCLMVAELPLIALKFKSFAFSKNIFRYILICSSLLMSLIFSIYAIPMIIILYVILSIGENLFFKSAKA